MYSFTTDFFIRGYNLPVIPGACAPCINHLTSLLANRFAY